MIHQERRGDVVLLTLDRPERRNALDLSHCHQLAELVRASVAAGARALVLAGSGPHFCAGADLTGVEDDDFIGALHGALDALATAPIPTFAAVQGAALGGGTQLAIACDLRVALPDARFGIPAAKLGLMVDHWTVKRLALVAGFGPARAMLVAAEEYDGVAAHRLGLVQRLGDLGDALAWATAVAGLAPLTMAGHKLGLNLVEQGGDQSSYREAFNAAWSSEDHRKAMVARTAKTPPTFSGR
ncbi:MAG: enoyl-CoA hydratase [Acidimicrobiales bacterium]